MAVLKNRPLVWASITVPNTTYEPVYSVNVIVDEFVKVKFIALWELIQGFSLFEKFNECIDFFLGFLKGKARTCFSPSASSTNVH